MKKTSRNIYKFYRTYFVLVIFDSSEVKKIYKYIFEVTDNWNDGHVKFKAGNNLISNIKEFIDFKDVVEYVKKKFFIYEM